MARARKTDKTRTASREASLRKRAAARGHTLEKEGDVWYAEIAGTRYGPMRSLDEIDEWLPEPPSESAA